MSYPAHS